MLLQLEDNDFASVAFYYRRNAVAFLTHYALLSVLMPKCKECSTMPQILLQKFLEFLVTMIRAVYLKLLHWGLSRILVEVII